MAKQKFEVTVEYTFRCTFEIEAETKAQAKEFALEHCGAVCPNYQSTITDEYEGDVHDNNRKIIHTIQTTRRK